MSDFDPDNPTSGAVEELSSKQEQQQIRSERLDDTDLVDAEENLTGQELEEDEPEREALNEVNGSDEQYPDPFEAGPRSDTVFDQVLYEVEGVVGYDGDAEVVTLIGELVDEEINEEFVRVDYTMNEDLVDTSAEPEIKVPGLQFADESTLQVAYQRKDVNVEINSTDQGYEFSFEYNDPESVDEAARSIGVAIGELDQEFRKAYNFEK